MKTIPYNQESINSYSMFNLTKLIKENYEKGTPFSKEYLDCIDLSEISKKTFYSYHPEYGQQNYNVQESAAINLINYLPFDYYKDYVDFNWIFYGSEPHTFAETCLYSKKFNVLKNILAIGQKYLDDINNDNYKKNIDEYERNFLSHITDILRITSNSFYTSKQHLDSYKEIFDIAIEQSFFIRNEREKRYHKKEQIVLYNHKEWFKHLSYLSSSHKGQIQSFINSILDNPEAYLSSSHKGQIQFFINSILDNPEAVIFLKDMVSDEKYKNIIFTRENIELALRNGNSKAFDFLKTNISLAPIDFQTIIKEVLNQWTDDALKIYSVKNSHYSNSKEYSQDNLLYNILTILENETNDFSFLSKDDIQYLTLVSNKHTLKKLVDMFPDILKISLNNLSLNEFLLSVHFLNEFMEKNELIFNVNLREKMYPTPELKIAANFSQIIPIENYYNKDYDLLSHAIKDNIISFFPYLTNKNKEPLNVENLTIIFNYDNLNKVINTTENTKKKIKL